MKRFVKILFILFAAFTLLLFLPFLFYTDKGFVPDENFRPFSNSQFLKSGKNKIHYRIWEKAGNTKLAFCIHGFSGSTFSFEQIAIRLMQEGYNIAALDLPAFGFSEKSENGDYSQQAFLSAINAVKNVCDKKFECKDYLVLGHSMGAMWASEAIYSGVFYNSKLIVIDGAIGMGGSRSENTMVSSSPILKWADFALHRWFLNEKKFSELLSSAYSREASKLQSLAYMQPFLIKNSASAIFRMTASSFKESGKWEDLKIPVLIISGENDQWIPMRNAFALWKRNKKAKFLIIPNAGHCPMETHVEETMQSIKLFLLI